MSGSMKIVPSFKEYKRCNCVSIREILKLISQILIPLSIGTFTLVISIQQHNLNKENRQKDIEIAKQLRKQQYELDEQRRTQELALDEARRSQDLSISENKQRDSVFNVYIRDLTNLLLENNYQLTRPMLNLIIRPMTLTVLRQLDSTRKVLLIKFLYESKMLRTDHENMRVDLTDGDLNGIHLDSIQMDYLSLRGASLINSSFISSNLEMSDFQNVDLTNSLFLNTMLSESTFYRARLVRTQFNDSTLTLCDFHLVDLTRSFLLKEQLYSTLYNMAILPNGTQMNNQSFIFEPNDCLLNRWQLSQENSISINEQCHFIAIKDNISIRYEIGVFLMKQLIQKREAVFHFIFQTNIQTDSDLHIDFIYYNSTLTQEIRRGINLSLFLFKGEFRSFLSESAVILSKTSSKTNKSFHEYVVSAEYPTDDFRLLLEIHLNTGDIYTDWKFYIQHADFAQ